MIKKKLSFEDQQMVDFYKFDEVRKEKIIGFTCYKCGKFFKDKLPACSNMSKGFDQCEACYNMRKK